MTQLHPGRRRASLALVLLAAVLPAAARIAAGPPGATVHIRWQEQTPAAARAQLESQFRLLDAEQLDATTWRYDLLDTSPDNIRALVAAPAIADTHGIDRPLAIVDPAADRTGRRQRVAFGPALVTAVDALAVVALLLAATFLGFAAAVASACRRAAPPAAATLQSVARFVTRGIPVIDAGTAGLFRIAFGMLALAVVLTHPVNAGRLEAVFAPNIQDDVHGAVIRWLSGQPVVADAITPWLVVTGLAFTAGLYTRTAYVLFAAGLMLWGFAAVAFDSTHPHATFLLTAVGLIPSRWGDARSVDARMRSTRPLPPSARYGYSVWLPGLVFGVAFAAAACAKLEANGLDWVLNGTVKYHFIEDSRNAAVDWGLQLARYPALAVLASLAAVVIELMVLPAAFVRSERFRCLAGLGAVSLLAGFRLFMGVIWYGWWILLLGFLPWERMSRLVRSVRLPRPAHVYRGGQPDPSGPPEGGHYVPTDEGGHYVPVTTMQAAVVLAIIAQQVVVSVARVERAPFFSHYPMYATTYSSPDAFDAARAAEYQIIVNRDDERVALSCNPDEDLVDEFRAALVGSSAASAAVWRAVLGCRPDLRDATGVTFEEASREFDWNALTFSERPARPIGTLAGPPR